MVAYHDYGGAYAIIPSTVRPRKLQPGKRTILVSVLLSFMLLMSQLLRALQLDQPPKITNVHILQSLASLNEEFVPVECIKSHLGNELDSRLTPSQTCRHLPPSRGLCSLIQNLFFSKKPPNCRHQEPVTFCELGDEDFHCQSPAVCNNLSHYVGVFSEKYGKIHWTLVSAQNLQKEVLHISQASSFGFLFIRCSSNSEADSGQEQSDETFIDKNKVKYTQLFLYPPNLGIANDEKVFHININLLMVDSLSRHHFYRSLLNTVKLLEELHEKSSTKVLDFEFFQAIKHRTYESLQALFSGYINMTEPPFGTYDVPHKPLPISKLFGEFKKKGYKTLWIEDLCWKWEWGLAKDLKVMNMSLDHATLWQKLRMALDIASIDSLDMTMSSCDILDENGKKDPFHNLPVVCFNGQYQHEYLLEYLQLYHKSMYKLKKPFISFTSTSVAHDESGVRVQTLDDSLAKYLKFAEKLENTITIIFSDHGNTYGEFIKATPEAQVETFNPSLFILIPKLVQKELGDVRMRILKDNEKKLVSLIDVHYMLLEIIQRKGDLKEPNFQSQYVVPGGLLSSIPSSRTCKDIPMLQPNLCICKDFESVVEPTPLHMALADYGLGILNNMILFQRRKGGNSGFDRCAPMKAIELRKVREVHAAVDLVVYKLDVVVESASTEDSHGIIFLTLEAGRTVPGIRFVSYERFDTYGGYAKCQDKSVELKLCICDKSTAKYKSGGILSSLFLRGFFPNLPFFSGERTLSDKKIIEFLFSTYLGTKPEIDFMYPEEDPCLYTIIHRYKSGIVLKGINFCSTLHKIEIHVKSTNMLLSTDKNADFILYPKDIKVLMGSIVLNHKAEWHWDHEVKIF